MYNGRTHVLFAKYAIPQMIGLLFNSIYLIVDGIFIGHRLGRDAMAAAAVSVPFIEVLIALSIAVASGAGIMISSQLGRKENEKAVQTFNTAILCSAGIGISVIIMGNIFLGSLAEILGSTPQIHDKATSYLWYIITFSPFLMFSFLLGGLIRNDGCPKLAMLALAFGSVSNMVLDFVFMYPLNMGIAGAALATAIGPVFSVAILLPHFLMKKGNLYFAKLKIRPHNIQRIFMLGFPCGIFLGIIYIAILLIKALKKYLKTSEVRVEGKASKRALGDVIKKHWTENKMTQEFVAESLGVSRQAVSKWESGISDPSTSNLFALAKLFNMSPEEFLKEARQSCQ